MGITTGIKFEPEWQTEVASPHGDAFTIEAELYGGSKDFGDQWYPGGPLRVRISAPTHSLDDENGSLFSMLIAHKLDILRLNRDASGYAFSMDKQVRRIEENIQEATVSNLNYMFRSVASAHMWLQSAIDSYGTSKWEYNQFTKCLREAYPEEFVNQFTEGNSLVFSDINDQITQAFADYFSPEPSLAEKNAHVRYKHHSI